jgi:hypothetical protein
MMVSRFLRECTHENEIKCRNAAFRKKSNCSLDCIPGLVLLLPQLCNLQDRPGYAFRVSYYYYSSFFRAMGREARQCLNQSRSVVVDPKKRRLRRSEWPGNVRCTVHDRNDTTNDNTSKPSPPIARRSSPKKRDSYIITIINLIRPLYRRRRIQLLASTWSRISRSPHRLKVHCQPSPLTTATSTNQARPKRARQQHHATRQFGTTTRTHGPTMQARSVRKITTHFSKTLRLSSSLCHKDATRPTRRLSKTIPARDSLKLGMKNYKPWSTQSSNCSSPRIRRQQEARRI